MNTIIAFSHDGDPHVQAVQEHIPSRRFVYIKADKIETISLMGSESIDYHMSFDAFSSTDSDISLWYRKPDFIQTATVRAKSPEEQQKDKLVFEYKKKTILTVLQFTSFLAASRGWFYLNDPIKAYSARNKPYQLMLAKKLGFTVPRTLITNKLSDIRVFLNENKHSIIKPLVANTSYGDLHMNFYTQRITFENIPNIERIDYPVFIQEEIPRRSELRVTLVGNKLFPCAIETDNLIDGVDIRNRTSTLPHKMIRLPQDIEKKCFMLAKQLGLNYAAIDIAYTPEGKYVFFEINPNGQYLWIEEKTGAPISKQIALLLSNPTKYKII